jgi:hypothetical protein
VTGHVGEATQESAEQHMSTSSLVSATDTWLGSWESR